MRPIWNGSISFGLLQVPVQLFTATRDIDLHFRLLDGRDKKQVRYERINSDTGEEVPWKEIVHAFEVKKGSYLVVDEAELKKRAPEQTQTIDIEAFCARCEIDPIYFEKPYYVAPTKKSTRAYALLRDVLAKSAKVGIARVVIRTRQYLAALHSENDALMLTLMRFDQEIVEPKAVGLTASTLHAPKVKPAELAMAEQLLESMSKPWKPSEYKDEFRTKLRALLEKRAKKGHTVDPSPKKKEDADAAEATGNGKVLDLMALLQKSIKHKSSSSSSSSRHGKKARAASHAKRAR